MDPTSKPPPAARWPLIAGALGAISLLILLYPIGRALGDAVSAAIQAHQDLVSGGLLVFAGLMLAGLVRIVYALGRRLELGAKQAGIVRMQNQQPIDVRDVRQISVSAVERSLELHYAVEQTWADRSAYPQLSSIHQAITAAPAPAPPTALQPSELPDPDTPQLIGDGDWRRWMDRAAHLLIAGRTEAGKTTLATALLAERALAGDTVLVLDPHYQPGKWSGASAIGGGNNFEAILSTLPLLIREMMARYRSFERGQPTEDFQRLTILIDEVPAIVDACMETTPSGRPRIVDPRWLKFAKRLGSEARKVRISVILMTQSTLVQDILINSQQRENYLRVGLGDRARHLLQEEASSRRRQQLLDLLRGQAYPAAMEWRGDFHLLDTAAVPDLAARPINGALQAWTPPPLPVGAALTSTPAHTSAPARQCVPPTEPLPTPTIADQIAYLLAERGEWLTSTEIAAALGMDVKLIRTELTPLERKKAIVRRPAQRPGREQYEYTSQSVNQPTPIAVSA